MGFTTYVRTRGRLALPVCFVQNGTIVRFIARHAGIDFITQDRPCARRESRALQGSRPRPPSWTRPWGWPRTSGWEGLSIPARWPT